MIKLRRIRDSTSLKTFRSIEPLGPASANVILMTRPSAVVCAFNDTRAYRIVVNVGEYTCLVRISDAPAPRARGKQWTYAFMSPIHPRRERCVRSFEDRFGCVCPGDKQQMYVVAHQRERDASPIGKSKRLAEQLEISMPFVV